MPVVQITILPQSVEKKAEMSKAITDDIHRITGIPKDVITISYLELPADSIASGGNLLSEKLKDDH